MYNYMGKAPLRLPLTLLTVSLVYGITLIIELSDTEAAAWTASALYWILFVFVSINIIMFATKIVFVKEKDSDVQISIWGFIDGYFALIHAIGGLFTSVVILGSTVSSHFALIPDGIRGYNLFFTYSMANTITFFNTVGQANVGPITAVASLWVMGTSVLGIAYLMLFLSLLFWYLTKNHKKIVVSQFPVSRKPERQRNNYPPLPMGRIIGERSARLRIKKT